MNGAPIRRKSWLLQGPHGPLRGDVYLPASPLGSSVVIGSHGFKGFKDWGFWPRFGEFLAGRGQVLVTFNFSGSGVGEESGRFTELDRFEADTLGRSLDDVGAVVEAVVSRDLPLEGADIRRLALLGHSRGGGLSIVRTSRDPRVRALVGWAAVADFERFTPDQAEEWRSQGFLPVVNSRTGQILRLGLAWLQDFERNREAYSPVSAMRRLDVPALLIHGTRDETVGPEEAEQLYRAAPPGTATLDLMPGAGHTFGAGHPLEIAGPDTLTLFERTADFLEDNLGANPK